MTFGGISPWTDLKIESLKELHAKGLSGNQIAQELELSRNAVIGKLSRMGLSPQSQRPNGGHGRPRRDPNAPKSPAALRGAALRSVESALRKRFGTLPAIKAPPLSEAQKEYICGAPVSIMELTSSTCPWIVSDLPPHSDHQYCGNKPMEGLPYCPHHAERAYAGGMSAALKMAAQKIAKRMRVG